MTDADPVQAALEAALGAERAVDLLTALDNYSNQPNAVKGAAKRPSDPELESAAHRVLTAASPRDLDDALDSIGMWGLLTLAARADATILDSLPGSRADNPKVAAIRRAATKHHKALAAPTAAAGSSSGDGTGTATAVPTKVSEVAAWLKSHPEADPALFAPAAGQRAAARRAALRALGSLATPQAFAVLAQYAAKAYSDADLVELHRAWGRFDRREFAATMFGPGAADLGLGVCSTIEGIGAVTGLRGLGVIFEKQADLSPLTECTELRVLQVRATEGSHLESIAPLAQLPQLRHLELTGETRGADLGQLAGTPIEQLELALEGADGSFLSDMPQLRGLKLSGGREPHPAFDDPTTFETLPVHPGLTEVILGLVRGGVTVVLYQHESWVPPFAATVPDGVAAESAHGYLRLNPAR